MDTLIGHLKAIQDYDTTLAGRLNLLEKIIGNSIESSNKLQKNLAEVTSNYIYLVENIKNNDENIMSALNKTASEMFSQTLSINDKVEKLQNNIETIPEISEEKLITEISRNLAKSESENEFDGSLGSRTRSLSGFLGNVNNMTMTEINQKLINAKIDASFNKFPYNLLSIGGHRDKNLNHELYDFDNFGAINRTIPRLYGNPTLRSYKIGWYRSIGFVYNKNELFLCGGTNTRSRDCLSLKKDSKTWSMSKSLALPELRAGAVVVETPRHGHLVTGGFSSEYFGVAENMLQLERPKIGIIDDQELQNSTLSNNNNNNNLPIFKQHMGITLPRFRHSCIYTNSSMICSGGLIKETKSQKTASPTDTVVILDLSYDDSLESGTFQFHSRLPYPIYDHCMIKTNKDNRLYIVGGNSGNELKVLEYFPERKIWLAMDEVLPEKVSRAACVDNFIRTERAMLRFNSVDDIEILRSDLKTKRDFGNLIKLPSDW